jgi:guanylate kinase
MVNMPSQSMGTLYVVSAPSGAGKNAILHRVIEQNPRLELSVSSTTRAPRDGETHGKDYYFFSRETFRQKIEAGEFAEWAEVHGQFYGTLRAELARHVDSGRDVVLQIDVQGMRNIKSLYPETVTVFIMPPSLDVLEQRLRSRGANSEDDIRTRLMNAQGEMALRGSFDYIIVNEVLDEAVADMQAILRANRLRASRVLATTAFAERVK